MEKPTANQGESPNNSSWYLLAEYSLKNFLPDIEKSEKFTAGLLFQKMRELSVPLECLENIEMTLQSLAREALARLEPAGLDLPAYIRVFFQKKATGEEMKGGWGYFIIERSGDEACSSGKSNPVIDLYLYREGG